VSNDVIIWHENEMLLKMAHFRLHFHVHFHWTARTQIIASLQFNVSLCWSRAYQPNNCMYADIDLFIISDGQAIQLRAPNGASSITFPENLIGKLNSSECFIVIV